MILRLASVRPTQRQLHARLSDTPAGKAVLVDARGCVEDVVSYRRDDSERHPYWRAFGAERGPRQ